MPATVRTRDEIRESLLAKWRTSYAPRRLLTIARSWHWALAQALGLELEGAEATAAAATLEAFPQSASEDGVMLHADFLGLELQPATAAALRLRVSGTPAASITVTAGAELVGPTGLLYRADAATLTLDGSGFGHVRVVARDTGAAANLAAGAVLTWVTAPAGLAATAVVNAATGDASPLLITGADQETVEQLRARVILARKEKAQGANRADIAGWARNVGGVGSAFTYPRSRRRSDGVGGFTWRYDVPGSVVLLPLAPAPATTSYVQNTDGTMGLGLSPAFTRIPTTDLRTRVQSYIEGTVDAAGLPVPEARQKQLRPATLAPSNYEVGAADETSVNVTLRVTTDPAIAPWDWGFGPGEGLNYNIVSATTTALTLNDTTGLTTGKRLAVFVGTAAVRGGWWMTTVAAPPVGNVVTLSTPLPVAPAAGAARVRPDCGLWTEIRRRLLAHFDQLGPGDAQVPTDGTHPDAVVVQIMCGRYPRPNDMGRDKVFPSDLIAIVEAIPGVIGVELLSTATVGSAMTSTLTPDAGSLATINEIRVQAG